MNRFDDEEESEATQYMKAHKSGAAGSVFGHCGPKDDEEEDENQ